MVDVVCQTDSPRFTILEQKQLIDVEKECKLLSQRRGQPAHQAKETNEKQNLSEEQQSDEEKLKFYTGNGYSKEKL